MNNFDFTKVVVDEYTWILWPHPTHLKTALEFELANNFDSDLNSYTSPTALSKGRNCQQKWIPHDPSTPEKYVDTVIPQRFSTHCYKRPDKKI